ncbi:hypothetical protein MTR67_014615 [Solanum verrucosum]|uniref:Uncharacterized protein n=1 Tax=Solanum verrucosum TaxID=315347 RepID=A0AAF0QFB7_SOLVR|nr:hypothetical protein MTR67_014615 [Solanum verrucosum]
MQASTNLCEPTGANVVAVAGYKTLLMELFCRVLLRRFFGHQSSVPRLYYSNLEDKKISQEWFSFANSDVDESLTGGDAIKLFAMSNLPRQELKQIQITDKLKTKAELESLWIISNPLKGKIPFLFIITGEDGNTNKQYRDNKLIGNEKLQNLEPG